VPHPYSCLVLPRAGAAELLDVATRRGWIDARTARVARTTGVPVVVLVVLVWLVVSVLRAGGAGPPPVFAEFVDVSSSSYIDVQLDSSAKSYGTFSAVLPGQGRVWPKGRVQAEQRDGGVVELRYDGPGYQDPNARPGGVDDAPAGPAGQKPPPPQVVPVRLAGQVDAARHVASVDVWVNGERHRIASSGQVSGAEGVVEDFLVAMRTGNWNKLYTIESPYMRNGSKRATFASDLANGGAVTTITEARTTGPTVRSTTDAGVSYARTPIRLTYGEGAGATKVEAILVLAVDAGSWKVLGIE
jgi:hypothetical protein